VAEQVAVGAVIFNDLVNDRVKDVEFDWGRALSFEGDSGPYVQYVHVRCESILRKWGKPVELTGAALSSALSSVEERALLRLLMQYPDVLTSAFKVFKPNILANYLLDVCGAFNRFYHNHKILQGEADLLPARLALVSCTRQIIKSGLGVLSMQAPTEM
jgi:arginyl-tRNA synthetase